MTKRILLFGHPLHPMTVHLPIGLLVTTAVWDVLGLVRPEQFWWQLAFWTLAAGLVTALLAAVTGLFDLLSMAPRHPAVPTALRHLVSMLLAVTLYGGSFLFRVTSLPGVTNNRAIAVGLGWLGLVALLYGGLQGGRLVYEAGVGTRFESAASGERAAEHERRPAA